MLKALAWTAVGLVALIYVIGRFNPEPEDTSGVRQCFSAWDGAHPELVAAVRAALHDPDSFAHVATVLAGQDGSLQRAVVMTYRARNPLGGTVTARASATIFPPACPLLILSLDH